ncbi:MAG: HD domain-containing protein, partial [Micrococcales bacterium]|nr:HD domain-containing protein [Micrococcales bacterium]
MTGPWDRSGLLALTVTIMGGLGVLTAAILSLGSPAWQAPGNLVVLGAFGLVIAIGEFWSLNAAGFRESAPAATAAAFGLAFTLEASEGFWIPYAADVVIAVAGVAMALGVSARYLTGRPVHPVGIIGRLVAIVIVVLLYRAVHIPQPVGSPPSAGGLAPWQRALLMLAIAGLGVLGDVLLTSSVVLPDGVRAWRRAFGDEVRQTFVLSSALAVTGVLIALAARPLGVVALPLFLMPLVLSQFAFRRYVSIRATYLQSIRTLSRLTDIAGYTPPGHGERVARLSVSVGRGLGVTGRELLDLEYAALLHDIGQVALIEPIPGGATVLAAPADQRRIERDSVEIIRETGV